MKLFRNALKINSQYIATQKYISSKLFPTSSSSSSYSINNKNQKQKAIKPKLMQSKSLDNSSLNKKSKIKQKKGSSNKSKLFTPKSNKSYKTKSISPSKPSKASKSSKLSKASKPPVNRSKYMLGRSKSVKKSFTIPKLTLTTNNLNTKRIINKKPKSAKASSSKSGKSFKFPSINTTSTPKKRKIKSRPSSTNSSSKKSFKFPSIHNAISLSLHQINENKDIDLDLLANSKYNAPDSSSFLTPLVIPLIFIFIVGGFTLFVLCLLMKHKKQERKRRERQNWEKNHSHPNSTGYTTAPTKPDGAAAGGLANSTAYTHSGSSSISSESSSTSQHDESSDGDGNISDDSNDGDIHSSMIILSKLGVAAASDSGAGGAGGAGNIQSSRIISTREI